MLDPPGTLLELVKLTGYLAFAWLCLRSAASRRGRQRLIMIVAAFGGLMALTGLVHSALGADLLFGIYAPKSTSIRPLLAPLINARITTTPTPM